MSQARRETAGGTEEGLLPPPGPPVGVLGTGRRWAAEYWDAFATETDLQWHLELARHAGPRALELGVGTGRLAIPMAASGRTVVGIDDSLEMLHIAHAKVQARGGGVLSRMRLLLGDIRDFSLPREDRFDLVYAPSGALNRCATRTELARALACVRDHLRVGGVLAFDLVRIDESEMDGLPRLAGVRALGDGEEVVRHVSWSRGPTKGDCEALHTFERFDRRGRSVERIQERELLHVFEPAEVAELLQLGGFEEVERYCDHEGSRSAGHRDRLQVYKCHRGP
jgi:SAM-dependent methyltransferase